MDIMNPTYQLSHTETIIYWRDSDKKYGQNRMDQKVEMYLMNTTKVTKEISLSALSARRPHVSQLN